MLKVIRRHSRLALLAASILLLAIYSLWALTKPLPRLTPEKAIINLTLPTGPSQLQWPNVGQSAVGVMGTAVTQTHGPQTPAPTASTAKIITALNVLRIKPLKAGEPGPTITLTASDVALYNYYLAHGGSVVPVQAGEHITERQMLEAMLLPSANNLADSLAIWAFGSLANYSKAANAYVQQLGLARTHIGSDASGFMPTTTSTAHDLVKLGELAMQNLVLAGIVGQPTATDIPLAASARNVNFLLGSYNIIGVKTGNSDQAGGVYVAAARVTLNNRPVTIVTALVGAHTLFESLKASLPLIQSAQANFKPAVVLPAGTVVGKYRVPWGGTIPAVTDKNLALTTWNGSLIPATAQLNRIPAQTTNNTVGSVTTAKSTIADPVTVPVKLQTIVGKPSAWWRLTHP